MENSFKVGDVVTALSDDKYYVTNLKNGFVGEVIAISGECIDVRSLGSFGGFPVGKTWETVESKYFGLIKSVSFNRLYGKLSS